MKTRILRHYSNLVNAFELALGVVVFVGIVIFAGQSLFALMAMDWSGTNAFYDLIYRVMLMVIGLEFIRMLITHDIVAVLELLAFVIARKMLRPDLVSTDIVLAVLGFVALLAARRYLLTSRERGEDEPESPPSGAETK